jgi:thiol-disulfide isomerase/thioredoxin
MTIKRILTSIIILIIFFVGFLSYKIIAKVKSKNELSKITLNMPEFKFYDLLHNPFTKDSLHAGTETMIIYFNPNCEHCQYEAEEIVKNAALLNKTIILFITNAADNDINKFDSIYHLSHFPFIKILKDSTNNFTKNFGKGIIPTTLFYDCKGKMIKRFTGEVKIDAIINLLSK